MEIVKPIGVIKLYGRQVDVIFVLNGDDENIATFTFATGECTF